MTTSDRNEAPLSEIPDALANTWAAVYVDVTEKLEAEQQAASIGQQDADTRPVEPADPPPPEGPPSPTQAHHQYVREAIAVSNCLSHRN